MSRSALVVTARSVDISRYEPLPRRTTALEVRDLLTDPLPCAVAETLGLEEAGRAVRSRVTGEGKDDADADLFCGYQQGFGLLCGHAR